MTDNEKAATFIWKPEDGCRCEGCTGLKFMPHGAGVVYPPDMTRPANYMRALETVCEKGLPSCDFLSVEIEYANIQKEWRVEIIENLNRLVAIVKDGTLGEAVVKALAALYDVEHVQK